jgi:hypothetical protein
METIDDVLAHFGVKGMKWGVRRNRSGRAGGAAEKERSPEAQKAHETLQLISKKGIGAASNDDLKSLQKRIDLEKKYKEAFPKKENPYVEFGKEFAKRVLIPEGEKQLKAFIAKKATTTLAGKEVVEVLELGKHSPGYGRHLKR